MSFTRVGDTAAYDKRTLAPLERTDGTVRHVNEIFGFSVRLCAEAGGKENDRRVTRGMALQAAGDQETLAWYMDVLVGAGIWAPDGAGWVLNNDPKYLHLLPQEEIERSRTRGRDENNDALTVPARLRDGDHCRFCNKLVNWGDRKSLRGGTYEHVNIANQPTQLHEYVVACFECNREPASRGPLNPPPEKPAYGPKTKDFVKKRLGRWPTAAEIAVRLEGLRTSSENAAPSQRPDAENAAPEAVQRPVEATESADVQPVPPPPERAPAARTARSIHKSNDRGVGNLDSPGRDGTERVGSGPAGSGPVVPGRVAPGVASPQTGRKRSRRGSGGGSRG